MNRRTALASFVAVVFAFAAASFSPYATRVEAQFPQFFGAERFPAIDIDQDDNLYLAISVATAPASEHRPHSQIFFTQSNDGGATWDNFPATRKLTNSPGEAFGPSIASMREGKTRIYIVYHDNSGGTTQSYLLRTKKKTKFKKAINITPHDGGAFSPRIALSANEALNIVWGDTLSGSRVVFVRSTDQGDTFTSPLDVSRSSGQATEPEIALDQSGAINVVWEDTRTGESTVMFARSTDEGRSFSEPARLSKGPGRAAEPQIAADRDGRLHVVWAQQAEDGTTQAFYARSADGGRTFTEPVNVSSKRDADIHKPVVTTFKDLVYIAYQNGDLFGEDDIRDRQVFVVKSSDSGASFGDPVQVSSANNSKGRAHSPAMVVTSRGVLHIVWIDSSIIGNDEGLLFYSNSSDGRRFSAQKMILAAIQ